MNVAEGSTIESAVGQKKQPMRIGYSVTNMQHLQINRVTQRKEGNAYYTKYLPTASGNSPLDSHITHSQ
jgi:hypothetical protein